MTMTGNDWTRSYKSLRTIIGQNIYVETRDGVQRQGRVTGMEFNEMEFMGGVLALPQNLELNGDPMDRIEFSHIKLVKSL